MIFVLSWKFESHSGEVYLIQHYVKKFGSNLRQVSSFLQVHVLWFPPPTELTRHDITEILLKVALNTVNQTKPEG